MNWGYISAQKLEGERSECFAVFIKLQTKVIGSLFSVNGTLNYSPTSEKSIKIGKNHDARKAVLATLSVLKLRGAIFRPRSSRPGVR